MLPQGIELLDEWSNEEIGVHLVKDNCNFQEILCFAVSAFSVVAFDVWFFTENVITKLFIA